MELVHNNNNMHLCIIYLALYNELKVLNGVIIISNKETILLCSLGLAEFCL